MDGDTVLDVARIAARHRDRHGDTTPVQGAKDVLVKPFRLPELAARVRAALDQA